MCLTASLRSAASSAAPTDPIGRDPVSDTPAPEGGGVIDGEREEREGRGRVKREREREGGRGEIVGGGGGRVLVELQVCCRCPSVCRHSPPIMHLSASLCPPCWTRCPAAACCPGASVTGPSVSRSTAGPPYKVPQQEVALCKYLQLSHLLSVTHTHARALLPATHRCFQLP